MFILRMGDNYWTGQMWARDYKLAKRYSSVEAALLDMVPVGIEVEQCM
jgi:hypothetical protein